MADRPDGAPAWPPESAPARIARLLDDVAQSGDVEQAGAVRDAFRAFEAQWWAAARARDAAAPHASRFGILGQSAAMQHAFAMVERFAGADFPVLIQGESGTGKELFARALHVHGPRAKRTFLSENCAAVPETLLESILFGHVRGAFTGAHRDNPGHFVSADGGTLFLDEVGDMSMAMQSKLLRVIETGEVRPVGGTAVKRVKVRIVSASNKNLRQLVERKQFREDLLFRLNVLTLELPPLRTRGEDIWLLAQFFAARCAIETGHHCALAEETKPALLAYAWPGNVRQLENEMRRAVAMCEHPTIGVSDLSPEIRG